MCLRHPPHTAAKSVYRSHLKVGVRVRLGLGLGLGSALGLLLGLGLGFGLRAEGVEIKMVNWAHVMEGIELEPGTVIRIWRVINTTVSYRAVARLTEMPLTEITLTDQC